jgi:hypothetical protein
VEVDLVEIAEVDPDLEVAEEMVVLEEAKEGKS